MTSRGVTVYCRYFLATGSAGRLNGPLRPEPQVEASPTHALCVVLCRLSRGNMPSGSDGIGLDLVVCSGSAPTQ